MLTRQIVIVSTLDYAVKNFYTGGDPQLEELRQEALKELAELRQVAVAYYAAQPAPIALDPTSLQVPAEGKTS